MASPRTTLRYVKELASCPLLLLAREALVPVILMALIL